jgi:hypothetical protein
MWDTKIKPAYGGAICRRIEGLAKLRVLFSVLISLKNKFQKNKRRKIRLLPQPLLIDHAPVIMCVRYEHKCRRKSIIYEHFRPFETKAISFITSV